MSLDPEPTDMGEVKLVGKEPQLHLIRCPHCGSLMSFNQTYPTTLKHLPMGSKPCVVELEQNNYVCLECGHTITPPLSCRFLNTSVTKDLALRALELTQYLSADREIAATLSINERLLTSILDKWDVVLDENGQINLHNFSNCYPFLDSESRNNLVRGLTKDFDAHQLSGLRLALSAYIKNRLEKGCSWQPPKEKIKKVIVDEVATKGRDYVTIFLDENGNVLFFVKGRGKAAVKSFIQWARGHLVRKLQVVADMHAPYLSAFKEEMPDCIITTDKFHLIQHLNEDVDGCLTLIFSQIKKGDLSEDELKELEILKTADFGCMLCKKELSSEEKQIIAKIGTKAPTVLELRKIVKLVHQAFDSHDKGKMKQLLKQAVTICHSLQIEDVQLSKYRESQKLTKFVEKTCLVSAPATEQEHLPLALKPAQKVPQKNARRRKLHPMAHFGQMVVNHWDSIINYAITGMTTAIIEGRNNLFKALKHAKYGIKNLDRFFRRFRLISRWSYKRHFTGHTTQTYWVQNQADCL